MLSRLKMAPYIYTEEEYRCGRCTMNNSFFVGKQERWRLRWWYAYKLQKTIQSRIARSERNRAMSEDGTFGVLPKKEVIKPQEELEKLQKNLWFKDMKNPRCYLLS